MPPTTKRSFRRNVDNARKHLGKDHVSAHKLLQGMSVGLADSPLPVMASAEIDSPEIIGQDLGRILADKGVD